MFDIVILIMLWIISCVACLILGRSKAYKNNSGEQPKKSVTVIKKENAEKEKFMKELENLFNYDGTQQE